MIRVLALALSAASLVAAPGTPGGARPTSGALRRAFEAGQRAVVEVSSPRGTGLGIVVGGNGEVLTHVGFVGLHEATVRLGDKNLPAKVRFAQADLGVALLSLAETGEGPFPAVAVYFAETPERGWILGLERGKKGKSLPKLGSIRRGHDTSTPPGFFRVSVLLPLGSPVFDLKGRLLGLVVKRLPDGSSRAIGIRALQAELVEPGP